jgi:hypothetical protein
MALDQFELPRAPPFLEPLFAQDGGHHAVMKLGEDLPMDGQCFTFRPHPLRI